jgi:hypothetical protein
MSRATRRWRSRRADADERKSPHGSSFWHVYDSTSFSIVSLNKRFMLLHPTLLVNLTSISLVTYSCKDYIGLFDIFFNIC